METVASIGDIEVQADADFARVIVDGETVLLIPRKDHGLDDLAAALTSLVL